MLKIQHLPYIKTARIIQRICRVHRHLSSPIYFRIDFFFIRHFSRESSIPDMQSVTYYYRLREG